MDHAAGRVMTAQKEGYKQGGTGKGDAGDVKSHDTPPKYMGWENDKGGSKVSAGPKYNASKG